MKRVCVFCGSSPGNHPAYRQAADELGRGLAERGWGLVFGGGWVGLMGQVAKAVMAAGGEAIGVIPQALLDQKLAYSELSDLRVVNSMHERKALMADLADGFIALPGGYGTLEEFFEVLTWAQLGIHHKPCGLLNVNGYFDRLGDFLDHAMEQQFIRPEHRSMMVVDDRPARLLERLETYQAPQVDKADWIMSINRRES